MNFEDFQSELIRGAKNLAAAYSPNDKELYKLDNIYIREEVTRHFGRGKDKLYYRYIKVFSFRTNTRDIDKDTVVKIVPHVTNDGPRRDVFIPADIQDLAAAENMNLGGGKLILDFAYSEKDLTYGDLLNIFYFFYIRNDDIYAAAKQFEDFVKYVEPDEDFLYSLYVRALYE